MVLLLLHHPPIPSQIVIKQTLKITAKATPLLVYALFDPFGSGIQPLVSLWAIMGPQNASILLTSMISLLPARRWSILYEKDPHDMGMSKAFSIPRADIEALLIQLRQSSKASPILCNEPPQISNTNHPPERKDATVAAAAAATPIHTSNNNNDNNDNGKKNNNNNHHRAAAPKQPYFRPSIKTSSDYAYTCGMHQCYPPPPKELSGSAMPPPPSDDNNNTISEPSQNVPPQQPGLAGASPMPWQRHPQQQPSYPPHPAMRMPSPMGTMMPPQMSMMMPPQMTMMSPHMAMTPQQQMMMMPPHMVM